MDPAFLRRMDEKIFVGLADPAGRRAQLTRTSSSGPWLDLMVRLTTNFSGANLVQLHRVLAAERSNGPLTDEVSRAAVLRVCENERIFCGDNHMPRMLPRIGTDEEAWLQRAVSLMQEKKACSNGTLFVCLDGDEPRLEMGVSLLLRSTVLPSILSLQTPDDPLDYQRAYDRAVALLCCFAIAREATFLQIVTGSVLTRNSVYDEVSAVRWVSDLVEECRMYAVSLVVFELDSLTMLEIEDSPDTSQPRQRMHRQALLALILDQFRKHAVLKSGKERKEFWVGAISSSAYITRVFRDQLRWPLPQSEEDRSSEARAEQECYFCGQTFVPADERNQRQCTYHRSAWSATGDVRICVLDSSVASASVGNVTSASGTSAGSSELRLKALSLATGESFVKRLQAIAQGTTNWTVKKRRDAVWDCCGQGFWSPGCPHVRAAHQAAPKSQPATLPAAPSVSFQVSPLPRRLRVLRVLLRHNNSKDPREIGTAEIDLTLTSSLATLRTAMQAALSTELPRRWVFLDGEEPIHQRAEAGTTLDRYSRADLLVGGTLTVYILDR